MKRWHHADLNNRMYCNLTDGKKIAMPRYYKLKIYTDEQRQQVGEETRARMVSKETPKEKQSTSAHKSFLQANSIRMAERGIAGDKF